MSIKISDEDISILNVTESSIITKIDFLFQKNNSYKDCSINDFLTAGLKSEVAGIFIGMWSFDFLIPSIEFVNREAPKFIGRKLLAYGDQLLDSQEIEIVINGLISVIRFSTVEEDIDEHYRACISLSRLLGKEAEKRIVDQIKIKPTKSLVEAMGFLVGHQALGVLSEDSLRFLEDIANGSNDELSQVAKYVLVEDVNRMMKTQYEFFQDK